MTKTDPIDQQLMHHALLLAERGLGNVAPNPAVGCVLVNAGKVVGRGWTQPGGRPHGETEAIRRGGDLTKGATAYVTLEPCAHSGQTGPCADALVNAKIARAVIATRDPDPRTSGKGIEILKKAGIEVCEGVAENEARRLNRGFFLRITEHRPLFALKIAASSDGCIATQPGIATPITNDLSRAHGHLLRVASDAVLFGIGTVLSDDPSYTVRLPGMEAATPVRVLLDTHLKIPETAKLLTTLQIAPLWIICGDASERAKCARLEKLGVRVIKAEAVGPDARPDLGWVAGVLADEGITRVLVEAGATLNQAFLDAGLIDAVHWFQAPKALGPGAVPAFGDGEAGGRILAAEEIEGMVRVDKRAFGGDIYIKFERNPSGYPAESSH